MPAGRVLLAYMFLAAIIAFFCYIMYRIFWYKKIVPEAKYTKWQGDEVDEAVRTARKILKGQK